MTVRDRQPGPGSSRLRVALIHHRYAPRGGMEAYLAALVRGFQDVGDSVELFVQSAERALVAARPVPVHTQPGRWMPHRLRPSWFARRIRRTVRPDAFDLVISLTRTNCQDVVVCGGTHRGYLAAMSQRPGLFDRSQVRLELAGFEGTPTIVAHSRRVAAEITDLYAVPTDRVVTIYPPVDDARFRYVTANERQRFRCDLGVASGKTVLLFAGNAHPCKRYDELLAALGRLPADQYELLVAGRCPPPRRMNVRALGFQAHLRSVYGAADLTVLPSQYEAFGLVVAESLACGTPVVVSDRVGAGELVGAGEGMVRPMPDAGAIARAIEDAAGEEMKVAPGFAERNGLTVQEHVRRMKDLAGRR